MSQMMPPPPPPPAMNYAQPGMTPTRTSAAAVTSLICGILGCFIVTGIIAVITGFIGISATKNPQVRGRGLAIAGLILGVITTLASLGFVISVGSVGIWAYKQYAPAIKTTQALIDATSTGDANKAMPYVDTTKVSREHIQEIVDELKPLGKPSGFRPSSRSANSNNGLSTIDLDGTLDYPNNISKGLSVQLTKQSDGSFKVTKLDVN